MSKRSQPPAGITGNHLGSLIGRSVVGNNDLDFRGCLSERALNGSTQKVGTVDSGDCDRQARGHTFRDTE